MNINKQIMLLLVRDLGFTAVCGLCAPNSELMPSDFHGPVSFRVSLIYVMGI